MKKFYLLILFVIGTCLISCNHKDSIWTQATGDLDARVTDLEKICSQMNTNISSLQTIVSSVEAGDYITNVTPIIEEGDTIGYTITFAKNGPITIYNGEDGQDGTNGKDGADGKDGQDGQNGADGKDGVDGTTPIIGVAKDTDNIYYWTLNGTWLLDANGQKIRVTGADGQNGQNGANGNDGISPKLKIENDYWYISYDNGATWTQLSISKGDTGAPGAAGKDGVDGKDGADGKDGDSMFSSVTYDDNNMYFTLTNGTIITIARGSGSGGNTGDVKIVNGAILAEFSVSDSTKVYFSMGNLQYQASTGTWRFAEHQYDIIGHKNENISVTYSGWIDLFSWGTSGYHDPADTYNTNYYPYSVANTLVSKNYNCYGYGPSINMTDPNLVGTSANYDWGVYNAISNGGNKAGQWRTLTADEWKYLFGIRANASSLYFRANVGGVSGMVILPDNWKSTDAPGDYILDEKDYASNILDSYKIKEYESYGAIFLPCSGCRYTWTFYSTGQITGYYWSSSYYDDSYAYCINFGSSSLSSGYYWSRYAGASVRLVKDIH